MLKLLNFLQHPSSLATLIHLVPKSLQVRYVILENSQHQLQLQCLIYQWVNLLSFNYSKCIFSMHYQLCIKQPVMQIYFRHAAPGLRTLKHFSLFSYLCNIQTASCFYSAEVNNVRIRFLISIVYISSILNIAIRMRRLGRASMRSQYCRDSL